MKRVIILLVFVILVGCTKSYVLENYKGDAFKDVLLELKSMNIDNTVNLQYNDEIPKGQIIDTVPSAGTKVKEGEKIELIISLGSEYETKELQLDETFKTKEGLEIIVTLAGYSLDSNCALWDAFLNIEITNNSGSMKTFSSNNWEMSHDKFGDWDVKIPSCAKWNVMGVTEEIRNSTSVTRRIFFDNLPDTSEEYAVEYYPDKDKNKKALFRFKFKPDDYIAYFIY